MLETKAFKEVEAPVKYIDGEKWTELKIKARTPYLVSTMGRIYSYVSDKIVTGSIRTGIYCFTFRPRNPKEKYVHAYTGEPRMADKRGQMVITVQQLVAQTFLRKPKGYDIVVHINYNKKDNRIDNLKWMRVDRGWDHSFDSPRYYRVRRNIKLNKTKVLQIKNILDNKRKGHITITMKEIAKEFGVSTMQIYRIQNGDLWKDVGEIIKKKSAPVKLSDETVKDIRQALKRGERGINIAYGLDVGEHTVSRIKNNKYYRG